MTYSETLNIITETEQVKKEVPVNFAYMEDNDYCYVVPADELNTLLDKRTSSTTLHYYAVLVIKKDTKEVVKSRYF